MVVRSPVSDVEIPDQPLSAFIFAEAGTRADKPALIDGPSGRTITYGELAQGARALAGGLAARGFAPGEVIGIFSPNLPEYALAFHGIAAAGGAVTTANPLLTADELGQQLSTAKARYLLTVPPARAMPWNATAYSGRFGLKMPTTPPGSSPRATSPAANACTRCFSSP